MDLLTITTKEEFEKKFPPPLLAHGFRPFFLLASSYGAFFLFAWLGIFFESIPYPSGFSLAVWHGHEMVFGFAAAAICGFLLTATATWSQLSPVTGGRLGMIVGVWTVGRMAMWLSGVLPPAVVAILDLALIPTLAFAIAPVIFSPGNRQNLVFLLFLSLYFLSNFLIHWEPMTGSAGSAAFGLRLGVNLLALLIVIIIGRIVPTLCRVGRLGEPDAVPGKSGIVLEILAIGSAALFLVADLLGYESAWAGWVALACAAIQGARMAGWRAGTLLRKPYMFTLHLGYSWIIAGYALKGVAYLEGPVPEVSALHAMTAGGIGTMILAVMSIIGLLHTGRPAEIQRVVVLSYLLVTVAAILRVTAPILFYEEYKEVLILSGVLWASAFAIYAIAYWPILSRPRPDGIPG